MKQERRGHQLYMLTGFGSNMDQASFPGDLAGAKKDQNQLRSHLQRSKRKKNGKVCWLLERVPEALQPATAHVPKKRVRLNCKKYNLSTPMNQLENVDTVRDHRPTRMRNPLASCKVMS